MLAFHCNACLREMVLFDRKNYLTKCSHIFCRECALKFRPNCAVCATRTSFMEINENMPQHFRKIFEPVGNCFNRIYNVVKFQENLRTFPVGYMRKKCWYLMRKGRGINQMRAELEEDIQAREEKISRLEKVHEKIVEFKELCSEGYMPVEEHSRKRPQLRKKPPEMLKFMVKPSMYEKPRPLSPRQYRFASISNTTLFNFGQRRRSTSRQTTPRHSPLSQTDSGVSTFAHD